MATYTLLITAYFTDNGAPNTGLSPTVNVYDLSDNSLDLSAQAMSEVANGCYKYSWSSADDTKEYYAIADGGAALPDHERYSIGTCGLSGSLNIIDTNVDAILVDTGTTIPGTITSLQSTADAIETDTQDLQTQIGTAGVGLTDLGGMSTTMKGQINVECDTALTDYDPPTKTEMDNAHALLATEAKQDIIDTNVDAIKIQTDDQPAGIKKNVALSNFTFLLVQSSDHITPKTSAESISSQISKDGGAFASCTNSVSEISDGLYKINLTQTEMNADIICLKISATSCDQRTIVIKTST